MSAFLKVRSIVIPLFVLYIYDDRITMNFGPFNILLLLANSSSTG